jgi:hypothetical protein
MKKTLLVILCSLCLSFPVHAELDEFGNSIDWVEENGGEDKAGLEEMDTPEESTQTQEPLKQMEEIQVVSYTKGTCIVKADVPNQWIGNDIILSIYDKTHFKKYDVSMSASNNYRVQDNFPSGEYEVRNAYVDGDDIGAYNLAFDTYSFSLDENSEITINITFNNTIIPVEEETHQENTSDQTENNIVKNKLPYEATDSENISESDKSAEDIERSHVDISKIVIISAIILCGIVIFIKLLKNRLKELIR